MINNPFDGDNIVSANLTRKVELPSSFAMLTKNEVEPDNESKSSYSEENSSKASSSSGSSRPSSSSSNITFADEEVSFFVF